MRFNRFTRLLLVAVLMMVAQLLAVAGSHAAATKSAAHAGTITIRFAGWIGMEASTAKQFHHMVQVFEAKHPNIKIQYEGVAWENTRQQLLQEAAAGNPPDAAQVAAPWIGQFAYSGSIVPLEGMAKSILPDYVRGVVKAYTFAGPDGKVHTWGLPWVAVHAAMFYNVPLMKRAHLNPKKLPVTIDQYYKVVKAIASLGTDPKGNKIWGLTTSTDRSELTANVFNQWLFNFGGDVLDSKGRVTINSPAGLKTLDFLKKLAAEKIMPVSFSFRDQYNLFVNGQSGSLTDGSYARDVLDLTSGKGQAYNRNVVVGYIPTALSNPQNPAQHRTIFHHHTLVVFKGSKHPAEAFEFIKFLSTDPGITLYYAKGSGLYPLYKPDLKNSFYSRDAYARTFLKALPGAELYNISKTPQYAQAVDIIGLAVNKALAGESSKKALDDAAASLKSLYRKG